MKNKLSLVEVSLLITSLVALMAWAFSAISHTGGLPARSGPKSLNTASDTDRIVVQVEPLTKPIVLQPSAYGEISSLKDLPAPPALTSTVLQRAEESELPRSQVSQVSGPDAIVQTLPGSVNMPSLIADFDGVSVVEQGVSLSPPDTNGDIGYDPVTGKRYYFQWVNIAYKAWDVTNPAAPTVVVSMTQGNALWQAALPGTQCANTNSGDPIVLFDEQAHRWFISQFSIGGFSGNYAPFHQCIAVSQSANPAGSWYVYDYAYRDATTYFNDYPHFGVWPDATYNAYFMTVHEFDTAGNAYLGQSVAAFDRARLLAGDSGAPVVIFALGTNYLGMLPADLDGTPPPPGTPGFFFMTAPAGTLSVWEFKPDWLTPNNSIFGVGGAHTANYALTIAAYTDACTASTCNRIPQLSSGILLDSLGDRLMHRVAFRALNGTDQRVVLNHTVDLDGSSGSTRTGLRWYEVRRDSTTGTWTLNQQSTYAPGSTDYRWMGSIAMDQSGNIALGYSASSSSINPSIRYAGRQFLDPLNTLPQAEVTMTVSTGAQTNSYGRWGDYSMMGVDPQDGCTFWYTQEYNGATASVTWKTRIGSFRFPSCAGGILSGTVTNANTSAPISGASVVANSTSGDVFPTTTDASGNFQTDVAPGTYTVTASALGYNPSTTTGLSLTAGTTTTLNFALTPLPQADLALVKSASISTIYVGGPLTYTLLVTNNGPDGITTTITLTDTLPAGFGLINAAGNGWGCGGTSTVVCTRTGLSSGASTSVTLAVTASAQIGTYANTASVSSALADLNPANNSASVNVNVAPHTDLAITKSGPATANPNATLVYTLNVTNNGPLSIGQASTTYTNSAAITITDNASANPYPAPINVANSALVQKVTAQLLGLAHTYPSDVDIILVGPSGIKSWLMSDVIGGTDVSNFDLTFDDAAAGTLGCPTVTSPMSGTYQPTDCSDGMGNDTFAAPAPTGPYTPSLALFNGTDASGVWNLYARDDTGTDAGRIANGWRLTLTTGYAGPITVTDVLPIGTTFFGAGGAGWSCAQASGVVTCTRNDLAAGASASLLITVTAPATTGAITNTATVISALADTTSSNNSAQAVTSISGAGYAILLVNPIGSGTVTKNPDQPSYPPGTPVTLTATPNPGWSFAGWSGDLSGSANPMAVTMNVSKIITATFNNNCVPLTGVGFTYTPTTPTVAQAVQFTSVITGGVQPITYTWNFGHGVDVITTTTSLMHSFPVTNVVQVYPVTLSAANACSNVAAPTQNVTVRPLSLYLPLVLK